MDFDALVEPTERILRGLPGGVPATSIAPVLGVALEVAVRLLEHLEKRRRARRTADPRLRGRAVWLVADASSPPSDPPDDSPRSKSVQLAEFVELAGDDKRLTTADLAAMIGSTTEKTEALLKYLARSGVLRRVGSRHHGHWVGVLPVAPSPLGSGGATPPSSSSGTPVTEIEARLNDALEQEESLRDLLVQVEAALGFDPDEDVSGSAVLDRIAELRSCEKLADRPTPSPSTTESTVWPIDRADRCIQLVVVGAGLRGEPQAVFEGSSVAIRRLAQVVGLYVDIDVERLPQAVVVRP